MKRKKCKIKGCSGYYHARGLCQSHYNFMLIHDIEETMRGETIERAFLVIKMFNEGPVTSRMLREKLGISKQSANRWIMQATRFLPVVVTGLDNNGLGRPAIVYELLKNTQDLNPDFSKTVDKHFWNLI